MEEHPGVAKRDLFLRDPAHERGKRISIHAAIEKEHPKRKEELVPLYPEGDVFKLGVCLDEGFEKKEKEYSSNQEAETLPDFGDQGRSSSSGGTR